MSNYRLLVVLCVSVVFIVIAFFLTMNPYRSDQGSNEKRRRFFSASDESSQRSINPSQTDSFRIGTRAMRLSVSDLDEYGSHPNKQYHAKLSVEAAGR